MTELSQQCCASSDYNKGETRHFAFGAGSSPAFHKPFPVVSYGPEILAHQLTAGITLITPYTILAFRFSHNHELPRIHDRVLILTHRRVAFQPGGFSIWIKSLTILNPRNSQGSSSYLPLEPIY